MLPPLLGLLFYLKGQSFDPAFFTPPAVAHAALPVPTSAAGWTLEGGEAFPADRMYEKIDGKADYYLQYGATELCSGEWVADQRRWDMYLYRFKDAQGARGAFTGERPTKADPLPDLPGYTVPGQIGLAAGPFYLQLVSETPAADTAPAQALARTLLTHLDVPLTAPDAPPVISPGALAGDAIVPESESTLPESAFGFSALNNVRIARVTLAGAEATWFTAPGDSTVLAKYAEELKLYGGEQLFEQDGATGGLMFGAWEMAGSINGAIWGIHAAPSREALLAHWNALQSALKETQP
jgi:hypothetical protein